MEKKNKTLLIAAAVMFICSTLFFLKADPAEALSSAWIDEKSLGELCIGQVTPIIKESSSNETADNGGKAETSDNGEKSGEETAAEDEDKNDEKIEVTGDPLVIIYHTHSTESYMPYDESNYHRTDEEGTVRDVGNVLENELKKKGINLSLIHI